MIQTARQIAAAPGLHVGIIMDGNGRWAARRGLPRAAGHREGSLAIRRIAQAAPACGISTMTLFAFSSDNWQRPAREVTWLMTLFREYLRSEVERCIQEGVRLTIIGRRDRLPLSVVRGIAAAETATAGGHRLHLRIALDYSGRDAILRAAQRLSTHTPPSREAFGRLLAITSHDPASPRDVDLLIRTGGERRLSDFLLWESAYAELLFTPKMWPDFGPDDLAAAVAEFHSRERRFGGLPGLPESCDSSVAHAGERP